MTIIDSETSPLQAAREWRGIGIVAAARSCGLTLAQAEALEAGETEAFESIDEMLAAAVLYGSSIGIGRDEAIALMDRAAAVAEDVRVDVPIAPATAPGADGDDESAVWQRPVAGFSDAVQARAARRAGGSLELDDHPALSPIGEEVDGPTPQQAIDASAEIHLDAFGADAPWEREGATGELEAWMADERDGSGMVAVARSPRDATLLQRAGATTTAALERVIGTDRSEQLADWSTRTSTRTRERVRSWREALRRSEHATLIVAIGGGAVLIAVLVAVGGMIGGGEEQTGSSTADRAPEAQGGGTEAAPTDGAAIAEAGKAASEEPTAASATAAAAATPVTPPAKISVDVYNSGSTKGKAASVAEELKSAGYGIGDVTNTSGDYGTATVIYPDGMAREAKALAATAGVSDVREAPGSTRRFTVIVQ